MKGEQTKLASLMEALFSTLLGLVVAVAATQFICYMYDIPMTMQSNLILTFWMTVLSIVRSYVVRRMWNAEFWTMLPLRWEYRHIDPDECCCGCTIGEGGDICGHGGCRSAKEYAISTRLLERSNGKA